jgi:cytidine deaminase
MARVENSDSLVPVAEGPELFIGLVAPLGVDLDDAVEVLQAALKGVGYDSKEVRMSRLLRGVPTLAASLPPPDAPEDERIEQFMNAADGLRREVGTGSVLVNLAMANIEDWRRQTVGMRKPVPRTAVIFNSLKRPEEVLALRKIYGEAFFALSIFTPTPTRIEALSRRIAKSRNKTPDFCIDEAQRLVKKDADAAGPRLGQNVEGAFPLGDVFVRGEHAPIRADISRLVDVLFSDPFRTPTIDECGMFQAKAAALRSADLSRQVGAAICDQDGSVIATGCNEVPKPGGGLYWEGESPDRRDFTLGSDPNAIARKEIIGEVLDALKPFLAVRYQEEDKDSELVSSAMARLKRVRISNLLEFGRVVHAEMNALMDAARRGVALKNTTLYCTTFPCHMCARHILAAGIRRVVYVEPYPKSLAEDMYKGAIVVDGCGSGDNNALHFDAFVGIAPRRFIDCFEALTRKDPDGYAVRHGLANARLRFAPIAQAHIERETACALELLKVKDKLGLT